LAHREHYCSKHMLLYLYRCIIRTETPVSGLIGTWWLQVDGSQEKRQRRGESLAVVSFSLWAIHSLQKMSCSQARSILLQFCLKTCITRFSLRRRKLQVSQLRRTLRRDVARKHNKRATTPNVARRTPTEENIENYQQRLNLHEKNTTRAQAHH
jgi:hypothetical protein